MTTHQMHWKVHTPGLIREVLQNEGTQILIRPLQIFAGILEEVATRASELNDPIMNELMCRLALYEMSDQYSPNYDQNRVDEIERLATEAKMEKQS